MSPWPWFRPTLGMDYFYRNGECDEVYFVHDGQGVLETNFGLLPYHEGDYIVIPRGTTFRFKMSKDSPDTRFLVIEAHGTIEPPRRYLNRNGQLLEHSPYCERDIRCPEELETHIERGEFEVRVKVGNTIQATGMTSIPSTLSAGMVASIPGYSTLTTLSQSPGASTSHLLCIRPSRDRISSSAHSFHASLTTTRSRSLYPITIATSIVTRCCTTSTATLAVVEASNVLHSPCTHVVFRMGHIPVLSRRASESTAPMNWR